MNLVSQGIRSVVCTAVLLVASAVLGCGIGLPGINRPTDSVVRLPPGQMTAALPASDLAVGQDERFLLAVIAPDNSLITDATVNLTFFKVTGPGSAELRSRAEAVYRESPELPGRGVYVARTDFDEPGDWGVAAEVLRPDQAPTELRVGFTVKPRSSTPAIGDPVPASRTPTGNSPDEVERFSSARPADPALYQLSVDQALAARKPFAVLFASPGFCVSQTCGPSVDVLRDLQEEYGDRANFIHVEVYQDAQPPSYVPAVSEWGLPSEPWLFIVGSDGRLVEKLEGSITVEEARPALDSATGTS